MSWLDELLKQTEESEAPERYFWWSGLAAISAVARKNVWLDRGSQYNLYPNIYVALISTKSGARKGIPISICKRLLLEIDLVRVISGCNSIQGIIEELGKQVTLMESKTVIGEAHGILLSDELDSFLTGDPKELSILTGLYGTHEHEKEWKKTLKNSNPTTLKSPCLTMLVASNEALFDSVVKRKDAEGGFLARVILVKEGGIKRLNSLMRPPKHKLDIPGLSKRLIEISKIKGQFSYSDQTADMYDTWYNKMMGEDRDDRTGTFNRLGDQVLKVAMLLSLARKDDLILDWQDIELAIDKCMECAETGARFTPNIEPSNGDRPNATKLIVGCLIDAAIQERSISKMEILNKLQQYQVTTKTVDFFIQELIDLGRINKKEITGKGHVNTRIFYTLTEEGREYLGWKPKKPN